MGRGKQKAYQVLHIGSEPCRRRLPEYQGQIITYGLLF